MYVRVRIYALLPHGVVLAVTLHARVPLVPTTDRRPAPAQTACMPCTFFTRRVVLRSIEAGGCSWVRRPIERKQRDGAISSNFSSCARAVRTQCPHLPAM